MARLLLNLRHVPDDEITAIREMLAHHDIDYYETPPNRWLISMGGIWIRDEEQHAAALRLLATFQAQRAEQARRNHAAAKAAGTAETLARRVREQPLKLIGRLALVVGILYLTLSPFTHLF